MPVTTWSTGFVWITQGGRCGRGLIVRTLFVLDHIWALLVRRANSDFVTCPTFHYEAQTDHWLVRVSLQLADRPSLTGNWKFNTSLLEIWDLQDRLESLVQRALVKAVTRNKWWGSLKQDKRFRHQIWSPAQLRYDQGEGFPNCRFS